MQEQGMVKLIFSSAFDTTVDAGMRLIEDPVLTKSASTVFGCDYADLLPDKHHVGIHLVAVGDFEHYGANRNGDSFPKRACIGYHHTFVKNGNLYRHHRNKDPEKRLGRIVKSAYNEAMGRIELFVHAHKEKARDELHRLATEGDIPFSMACKVAYDRCSVCGTLRKFSKDPNQCDHIRFNLGKVADDGTVTCTHNDEPNWFDISFVTRPADRIAWHLKTASGELIDSVKLAEAEGIWVPDHIAIMSAEAKDKFEYLKKLAEMEALFRRIAVSKPVTSTERYFWELRKAAGATLDDKTIDELRKHSPESVFYKLAKVGVIMDVNSFYKYAMGPDYGDIASVMPRVREAVSNICTRLVKSGECQRVCNEMLFDVNTFSTEVDGPSVQLIKDANVTLIGHERDQRVIESTIDNFEISIDTNEKIGSNITPMIDALAEKYAAYKLSAIKAVLSLNKNTDTDALLAVAAAQNLIS